MNEHAVIKAEYADYKRVKGRKVLQIVCEVPIEQAPEVHKILGEPTFGNSTWVAIAKLAPGGETKPEEPKERRSWNDLKPSQQAGIRCGEPAFKRFLHNNYNNVGTYDDPAEFVRAVLGVYSRSQLDEDEELARRWHRLERDYQAWLVA